MANTKTTKEEIEKIIKLSNIDVTQIEQDNYSKDLSEVIDYSIKHLEKLNTVNVLPTAHATGEKSITRTDSTEPGLSEEESVKNTRNRHINFFKVKHVFGDD